jgi:predicted nucleic acid-binding protein
MTLKRPEGLGKQTAGTLVVLELAWVLRSSGLGRPAIAAAVQRLLALPRMRFQSSDALAAAARWTEAGMDFADALHLALSGKAERFATFDEALVKQARKAGALPVVEAQ